MDILRERDEKSNLERQLREEQKFRAMLQKKLRREKRTRRSLQEQIELETKRRTHYEEALRNAGAADQINDINEKFAQNEQRQHNQTHQTTNSATQKSQTPTSSAPTRSPALNQMISSTVSQNTEMMQSEHQDKIKQEVEEASHQYLPPLREAREQSTSQPNENKGQQQPQPQPWGYSGLDLINSGAAFWQNYSESLAQELEMERKARQQQMERDVKSPLQDCSGYYKNSVLFTSSAT